jgi:hypothetical protein
MSDLDIFNRTESKIVQEREKAVQSYNSTAAASQAIENYGQGLVMRLGQIFQAVTELSTPSDQLSFLASEIEKFRDIITSDVESQRTQRLYLQARVQSLNECVGLVRDVQNEMEQEQKQSAELLNREAVKRVSEQLESGEYDPEAARSTGTRPERLATVRQAQTLSTLGSVSTPK